ncbi:NAD-binding protein [Nonomuraea sp. NEAU-A123]|uniref:NAD-binding protein n=1 Tax=Nonomuraea sp. NEAU-A123 TaxID=2839649 RepID=UPI001BE4D23F|nr:NAD-binding protein [Nonomuraea sp. NEAU-A123]MBT2234863.1 NAD-binding protein [Nonomuraea sp. NEAU-A123]
MKLIVNSWMAASVVAMADTLLACRQLGVDPGLVLQVLDDGPLRMPYAMQKAEEMRAGSYPPGFPLALALKDLDLLAGERDLPSPLSGVLQQALQQAVEEATAARTSPLSPKVGKCTVHPLVDRQVRDRTLACGRFSGQPIPASDRRANDARSGLPMG